MQVFQTISDLKSNAGIASDNCTKVLGYYSPGGGDFYFTYSWCYHQSYKKCHY